MSDILDIRDHGGSSDPDLADEVARQRLREIQDRFIGRWGELARVWGTQRSGGRVHSLLYISAEPLDAEGIGKRLQISHGNTSTTVRQLLSAGVIRKLYRPGERRAFFTSEPDPWQWMRNTIRQRCDREVLPVIRALRTLRAQTEALQAVTPPALVAELRATRDKMSVSLDFLEQLLALVNAFLSDPQGRQPDTPQLQPLRETPSRGGDGDA